MPAASLLDKDFSESLSLVHIDNSMRLQHQPTPDKKNTFQNFGRKKTKMLKNNYNSKKQPARVSVSFWSSSAASSTIVF